MGTSTKFSIQQRRADDVLVVDMIGDLLLGPATTVMREEMYRILDGSSPKVLLNLAGVRYMDSTGVGALLGAKTSAVNRQIDLKICCVPSAIAKLLDQLHLSQILDIHEEESAAVATFGQQ